MHTWFVEHLNMNNLGVISIIIISFRLETLFLLYMDYLTKNVPWSLVNIYVDNATVYRHTSQNLEDQNLEAHLSSDLTQAAQWGKDWLIKSNTDETKLVILHQHRTDAEFSPIMMDFFFKEQHRFRRLVELKISPDHKWNSCMRSAAKYDRKWLVHFELHSIHFLVMIQKRLRGPVGDELISIIAISISCIMMSYILYSHYSNLYNWSTPCHVYKCETSPFPLYSISKE